MATLSTNNVASAIYTGSKDKEGKDLSLFVDDVIKFLVRKKLLSKSKDILEKLERISNKDKGILKVKIFSAVDLAPSIKKELNLILLEKYKAKSTLFTEVVDKKYIGGLKIEVDDEVIDMTISNKLKKLQAYLAR